MFVLKLSGIQNIFLFSKRNLILNKNKARYAKSMYDIDRY